MPAALLLALLTALPARAEVTPPEPGEVVAETPPPPRSPRGREAWDGFHRDHRRGRPSDQWFEMLLGSEGREAKPYIEYFARLMRQASRDPRVREMWAAYARQYRDDPDAYRGLGRASFEKKDYPSTVASFTRAIDLGAQTPDVYLGRGLAADILGDHELAFADSQAAGALAPGDGRAYALGRLTAGRPSSVHLDPASGLPAAAPPHVSPPPAAAPPAAGGAPTPGPAPAAVSPNPVLVGDARRRLALGDAVGAIKAALAAAQADPKDAEARNLLATAFEKTGRHAEAEAAASEALALAPDSVPALNTRAWARAGQRKFPDALADARRLLALAPDNAFGYAVQARALGGLGERTEMVDSLATAARLDPRFAELRGAAVRLPKDADTELLFGGLGAAAPASAPAPSPSRKTRRFLTLLSLSLGGGL
ncbi:tetratricopeptide repeat protein, partial [bacterium]